uniref:Polyprotein protein n=1 Tax=Solanum tuberosum TaxID=4113 RepID=M1DDV6_SOLTU
MDGPTSSMARAKVPSRGPPPRKKAKGVMIATEVEQPQPTCGKPPQTIGKGSGDPDHTPVSKIDLVKRKHLELRSKATHDPLALTPTPHASEAPQVPLIPVYHPRSMNRLKVTGLQSILEEKRFSTDGVVDKYPIVWETLRYHKFKFTQPRGPYVPTWVWEFYEGYAKLIPKGKKRASLMAPIDFVEDPSSKLPTVQDASEIPLDNVIKDATTVDEDRESDTSKMDEDDLVAREVNVYEDLEDLECDLLRVAMKG